MDEEFKLCWKNFQDNIASGFQNLYDRGDLVDVTLACDGKLLHAHKIVLAICSPYFQEIFITNPCKHPIIILKDVTFNIMCELLEFMYQGVVNVKHTELQSFMKIGQLLQIKGLATNASAAAASSPAGKSASQTNTTDDTSNTGAEAENNSEATAKTEPNRSTNGEDANRSDGLTNLKLSNPVSVKSHSPPSSPSPMGFGSSSAAINQQSFKSSPDSNMQFHQNYHTSANLKRHADINNDALSIYSRKQYRRSMPSIDHNADHSDSADADADSDYFLSSLPHLGTNTSAAAAAAAFRGTFNPTAFGFDYNLYKSSGVSGMVGSGIGGAGSNNPPGSSGMEYPNDLHIPSDYKNFANHVDIPPNSSNVVMLSSTSLLHGSCVFNRNNTVATQQGMKTYWLCKSYRISMCRARCITHQGRVISATGVHNHPPHMRGGPCPGPGSGSGNINGGATGNIGCGGTSAGFSTDTNTQQSSSASTSISPTMNLNPMNMSGVLLPGCGSTATGSVNVSSGMRLHHTAASGVMGSPMFQQHNPVHNSPAHQLQLHHHQQQQQQLHSVDGTTSPPPMSASLMGTSHAHAHIHSAQSATSSFMQHHSNADGGANVSSNHNSLHHHHQHGIGSGGASISGENTNSNGSSIGGGGNSGGMQSNSVLQNILNNTTSTNAMHHHNHHHSQLSHMCHLAQQQQHQHQPQLEITPLIHSHSPPLPTPSSSLHLDSPTNHSGGSCGANSLSSPITAPTTITAAKSSASNSNNIALKSPAQSNRSDESVCVTSETQSHQIHTVNMSEQQQQHHMLTTVSPTNNINSNTAISTHSTDGTGHNQHQAHVIDSITISPSGGHNFKIEDM